MIPTLWRWLYSLDGVRWVGGAIVVCLVVAVMRQNDINSRVDKKLDGLGATIGAAVDSSRYDHQLILEGLYRIERRQERLDGPRDR